MIIGSHLSISKGFTTAYKEAKKMNANTFQFFTRNPRGGKAKALDIVDLEKLAIAMNAESFGPILAHASYTMNLCSDKESVRTFARETLKDDIKRLSMIPNALYNFHPGSHVGQGVEAATQMIIDALNEVVTEHVDSYILLELMSGKGTEIGRSFEEIATIIHGVKHNKMMGVCLDTCHVYSAGYDIVNDLDGVIETFDKVIGLDRLKAIHLNDSKMPYASNKDRHEKIGEGTLGVQAIKRIINHPQLRHLPFYLETPNDAQGYKNEILTLKEWREE